MKLILVLICFLFGNVCMAADLTSGRIVLLQPDQSLEQKGFVVSDFASYIKSAEVAATTALQHATTEPSSGFLVIAVRAGNKSNVWLDFSPSLSSDLELSLINGVRNVPPFHVSKGTVIFAIELNINGAVSSVKKMPNPIAWQKAASKQSTPIEVEKLVELVWP